MRLGQLSRKLSIKPEKIVEEIQTKFDVTITKGLNTKIEDKFVEFFEEKYSSSIIENAEAEVIETTKVITKELKTKTSDPIIPEEKKEVKAAKEKIKAAPKKEVAPEKKEEEKVEEIELIKAPKIKLEGPKVIDKIDLPEPKPQFIEIDGVIVDKNEYRKSQEFKKKEEERKRKAQRKAKENEAKLEFKGETSTPKKANINEFAIKEKEEKEKERILEKRRVENEKRERELRKKHYEKQLEKVATAPKPKKKKPDTVENSKEETKKPIVHKNWLAKLIHWFKTE